MTPNAIFKLLVDMNKDKSDDFVLSIGHWQNDLIYGPPMQEFVADLRLDMGEVRKMLKLVKKKKKVKHEKISTEGQPENRPALEHHL